MVTTNSRKQEAKDQLTNKRNLLLLLQPFMALSILSGTIWVKRYQKGKTKTNLDFLEQVTVSSTGISWAICKSAPRPSQITTPAPHPQFFALPAAQPTASKH